MQGDDKIVITKLKTITLISLLFMTIELLGGYFANSIAIFADAFHLLSDVMAYSISLLVVFMSYRKSSRLLTFGYEKLQPLGALANVAIIWFVTAQLFFQATKRIIDRDVVEEPVFMFWTSIFGLGCNLCIMSILHKDSHGSHTGCTHGHDHKEHEEVSTKVKLQQELSHLDESCSKDKHHHQHRHHNHHNHHDHHSHHGHQCSSHQHKHSHKRGSGETSTTGGSHSHHQSSNYAHSLKANDIINQEIQNPLVQNQHHQPPAQTFHNNINIKAAYIHILTDIILSIGVIISATIIYFGAAQDRTWSSWKLADPMCTYLFSILAIYSTIPIVKQSCFLLLDGCDNPALLDDIQEQLRTTSIVEEVECLKVWSTSRGNFYGALRVKVHKGSRESLKNIFSSRKINGFVHFVEQQRPLLSQS